jgi:hypothetical protein
MARQRLMSQMKGARPINSSTLTQGRSTFSHLAPTHIGFYQVGIRRTMGRHCHDDRIPGAHVLSVDMSLVL